MLQVCRLLASLKSHAERLLLAKLEDVVSMQMTIHSKLSGNLAPYLHKGKLGSTDLPDGLLSEIKSERQGGGGRSPQLLPTFADVSVWLCGIM